MTNITVQTTPNQIVVSPETAGVATACDWNNVFNKPAGLSTGNNSSTNNIGGANNIYVKAAEMIPKTTSGSRVSSVEVGATFTNLDYIDFDSASRQYVNFDRIIPNNWNLGPLTGKFYWTADSGSGGVAWELKAKSLVNGSLLNVAFGTVQQINQTFTGTSGYLHISTGSFGITPGGTLASGALIIFEASRLVSDSFDTLGADARLIGIQVDF